MLGRTVESRYDKLVGTTKKYSFIIKNVITKLMNKFNHNHKTIWPCQDDS